ncbi:MAG: efflux RND transporter periplasmic adaptor subunit [Candidatus Cloacimonetes bacterium]|nr:efflux RND transporter periplasmic adaptor subunit [Candidatus Cloacimonadota bacterium]
MKLIFKFVALLLCIICGASIVLYFDASTSSGPDLQQSISIEKCEHKLEIGTCAFCDPKLIESLGFCHGHGVPEAFCTRCNSDLIVAFQHLNDWCKEHKLPESQCQLCKSKKQPNKKTSKIGLKLFANTTFRSQSKPNQDCKNQDALIRFIDSKIMKKSGIKTSKLAQSMDQNIVSCNAQIKYNQNKLAHITPRAKGVLTTISKDIGDSVLQGEVLAKIHSNEFSIAKSEYFQALTLVKLWEQNHQSELALQQDGATSSREVLQTKTKLVESQIIVEKSLQKLRNLGLNSDQIKHLKASSKSDSKLSILSPFNGHISKRHAVTGEMVTTSKSLFTVVDTSKMWAFLDILPSDLTKVNIGQNVEVKIPELSPLLFSGVISWIDSAISESSRTLKAKVELSNQNQMLKSGMFGTANIIINNNINSLLVHKSSVQWDGCCNVIFIKNSPQSFITKKVTLKPSGVNKDYYLAQGDIKTNDEVATTGSFLLKTELMKDNIGAGCCEADSGK